MAGPSTSPLCFFHGLCRPINKTLQCKNHFCTNTSLLPSLDAPTDTPPTVPSLAPPGVPRPAAALPSSRPRTQPRSAPTGAPPSVPSLAPTSVPRPAAALPSSRPRTQPRSAPHPAPATTKGPPPRPKPQPKSKARRAKHKAAMSKLLRGCSLGGQAKAAARKLSQDQPKPREWPGPSNQQGPEAPPEAPSRKPLFGVALPKKPAHKKTKNKPDLHYLRSYQRDVLGIDDNLDKAPAKGKCFPQPLLTDPVGNLISLHWRNFNYAPSLSVAIACFD